MKAVLIIFVLLVAGLLCGFFILAHQSKTAPKLGLVEGRLAPCKQASNCVNSMEDATVEIMTFDGVPDKAWLNVRSTIEALGGEVKEFTDNYLWATFRSKLFGFVDDVELLMEPDKQRIHIRSASRVGRSDFSANRNRVETIRNQFMQVGT